MRNAYEEILKISAGHPLIALSLLVFVGIPLLIGWMHEARFFAECGIVGIRFFKHEVSAWRGFLKRLRAELRTWE
ncbi:MAG TPA: hypothetical protein VHX14_02915 [Thermoanaerobaculia bacterium]|jgi:ACR3 family arsenite efflux pump ArsB|nr:hypothetical protein [Thermoanaerobaculia bacterium]